MDAFLFVVGFTAFFGIPALIVSVKTLKQQTQLSHKLRKEFLKQYE